MKYFGWVGVVVLWAASLCLSAPLKVVTTGDSITGGYYWHMSSALKSRGVDSVVPCPVYGETNSINTSRGGMTGPAYIGAIPWPGTGEQINYSLNVIAAEPDVIVFGIGVNDAYFDSGAAESFAAYKQAITQVFTTFHDYAQEKSGRIVVIGSILPFDLQTNQAYWKQTTWNNGALDRIQQYNAWLRGQSSEFGFVYCDTWSAIPAGSKLENVFRARWLAPHRAR